MGRLKRLGSGTPRERLEALNGVIHPGDVGKVYEAQDGRYILRIAPSAEREHAIIWKGEPDAIQMLPDKGGSASPSRRPFRAAAALLTLLTLASLLALC